jgi:hypothetical protein
MDADVAGMAIADSRRVEVDRKLHSRNEPSIRVACNDNERDHEAWMSSIAHIRATPGFPNGTWPTEMSAEQNLADLVRHARDFAARTGFTYSVLDGDEVIGCVYLYPTSDGAHDVEARSWVRASRAELDVVLWEAVSSWLTEAWPFERPLYEKRR